MTTDLKVALTWENAYLVAGRQGESALSEAREMLISLAIVDDQTMFREGLGALIERESDLSVMAQTTNLDELEARTSSRA